jgi:hypothetical protein
MEEFKKAPDHMKNKTNFRAPRHRIRKFREAHAIDLRTTHLRRGTTAYKAAVLEFITKLDATMNSMDG